MNYLDKNGLIYLWSLIKAKFAAIGHRHDNATTSADGFMSSTDKTKLDGIATGATANTGTVTSVATGVGLTGGTITSSGTVKAKLKTETAHTLSSAAQTNTASRQYAVGVDKDGYLSVNVPWTAYTAMTDTEATTGTGTTARVITPKVLADYVTSKTEAVDTGVMSVKTGSANGNISVDGTDVPVKGLSSGAYAEAYTHPTSGVTAGAYGPTANVAGSNNTTIKVPQVTVDANGHVTAVTERTYTSKDTTYTAMTDAEATTGTGTTARVITPKVLADYVNGKISSVYKPQGSLAFANLPTPSASNLGYVWNVTDAFTTTSSFLEGAGAAYPAGTNVMVVQSGSTYKFDCLSGAVDLSGYAQLSDLVAITNAEIDAIAV